MQVHLLVEFLGNARDGQALEMWKSESGVAIREEGFARWVSDVKEFHDGGAEQVFDALD